MRKRKNHCTSRIYAKRSEESGKKKNPSPCPAAWSLKPHASGGRGRPPRAPHSGGHVPRAGGLARVPGRSTPTHRPCPGRRATSPRLQHRAPTTLETGEIREDRVWSDSEKKNWLLMWSWAWNNNWLLVTNSGRTTYVSTVSTRRAHACVTPSPSWSALADAREAPTP